MEKAQESKVPLVNKGGIATGLVQCDAQHGGYLRSTVANTGARPWRCPARVDHSMYINALREFNAAPGVNTLAEVFLSSKALLAKPGRGGRARKEAVMRTVKVRRVLCSTVQFRRLWKKVSSEQKPAKQRHRNKRRNVLRNP